MTARTCSRSRIRPFPVVAAAVATLLAGCSNVDPPSDEHSFVEETVEGVVLAINSPVPRFESELFVYEPVLTLKEDEREASMLLRPEAVHMDARGYYYVEDPRAGRIAVFDAEGVYDHDIGRPGQGPGELQYGAVQRARDGVVSVWDGSQSRTTRFRTDGTLIDVTTLPLEMQRRTQRFEQVRPDLFLHIRRVDPPFGNRPRPQTQAYAVTAMNSDSDTVWSFASEPCEIGRFVQMEMGGATVTNPMSYVMGPLPSVEFHPDFGILVSDGISPELTIYGLDGDAKRRIRLELPPEPVTDEERARVYAQGEAIMAEMETESSKDFIRAQMENQVFPEFRAPWRSAEFDDQGYIWLRVPEVATPGEERAGPLYRVLSPSGEYLGLTRRPPGRSTVAYGRLLVNQVDSTEGTGGLVVFAIRALPETLVYP
jgi:hypothetical protein